MRTRLAASMVVMATLLLGLGLATFATAQSPSVDEMENQLFGHTFAEQPLVQRLERLELLVLGELQQGDAASRQARLVGLVKKPDAPRPTTYEDDMMPATDHHTPWTQGDVPVSTQQPQPNPDVTDYPMITSIEQAVYSRNFAGEALPERLNRLETHFFSRTFPELALVDRVDQLDRKSYTAVHQLDSQLNAGTHQTNLKDNRKELKGSTGAMHQELDVLEEKSFGGVSQGKLLTERLDALERRNFGRTFGGESPTTRIGRLQTHIQHTGGGPGFSGGSSNTGAPSVTQYHFPQYTTTQTYTVPAQPAYPQYPTTRYNPPQYYSQGAYGSTYSNGVPPTPSSVGSGSVVNGIGVGTTTSTQTYSPYGMSTTAQQRNTTFYGAPGTTYTETRTSPVPYTVVGPNGQPLFYPVVPGVITPKYRYQMGY